MLDRNMILLYQVRHISLGFYYTKSKLINTQVKPQYEFTCGSTLTLRKIIQF